jgi:hypothetical protein
LRHAGTKAVSVVEEQLFLQQVDTSEPVTPLKYTVTAVPDQGALVDIELGLPKTRTLVSGFLRVAFTGGSSAAAAALAPRLTAPADVLRRAASSPERPGEAEAKVKVLASRLSPAEQAQFRKPLERLKKPAKLIKRAASHRATEVRIFSPRPTATIAKVTQSPDARTRDRRLLRARMLCQAYGNQIPGVPPSACEDVMRTPIPK